MAQITAYKIGLDGEVLVQAIDADDAKAKALAHFAAEPLLYVRVLEIATVIIPEEA